ncbi:hypothetical protein KP79_PYT03909 [Mizuhopecten yessoensis]|uniref:FFamide n=1 Tax=Mizuhopecten yessoensis TaxID=6573 RepID=A0A210PFW1_MIZYE|nr:FFamide [Mizuhopecten yessoensis]OWF35341.1 hypothetical protein KP79_PYT03909 [Mizuhopecten yessoensis]
MNLKIVCTALVLSTLLLLSHASQSQPSTRALSRLLGQQPLLFGRRGMNPNMNSLFFGKRSMYNSPTNVEDVREALASIYSICQTVMQTKANLVDSEDP